MTVTSKIRLDNLLVDLGLTRTRSQARDLIKRGVVSVDGNVTTRPGQSVACDAAIKLLDGSEQFVSRAALKLKAALDTFGFSPADRYCMDIGASTGGFTELLLKRGAKHVTAVDVGQGQLHEEIAANEQVTSLESTDARSLTVEQLRHPITAITVDVSFISLTKVLVPAINFVERGTWLAALVKPQFEVGKEAVGKRGIVRSDIERERSVEKVTHWIDSQPGWRVVGTVPSPITGQGGNQETLLGAFYEV